MRVYFKEINQMSRLESLSIPNGRQGTLRVKLDWATHTEIWGAYDKVDTKHSVTPNAGGGQYVSWVPV